MGHWKTFSFCRWQTRFLCQQLFCFFPDFAIPSPHLSQNVVPFNPRSFCHLPCSLFPCSYEIRCSFFLSRKRPLSMILWREWYCIPQHKNLHAPEMRKNASLFKSYALSRSYFGQFLVKCFIPWHSLHVLPALWFITVWKWTRSDSK